MSKLKYKKKNKVFYIRIYINYMTSLATSVDKLQNEKDVYISKLLSTFPARSY